MERKRNNEPSHPLINLDDILELLFYDNSFGRCWKCKKTCLVNELLLKPSNSGWSIICWRCCNNNYFSS